MREGEAFLIDPKALSKAQLIEFASDIQSLLYLDMDREGEFWNENKGFPDEETVRFLKQVVKNHGLGPRRPPREWSPRRRL